MTEMNRFSVLMRFFTSWLVCLVLKEYAEKRVVFKFINRCRLAYLFFKVPDGDFNLLLLVLMFLSQNIFAITWSLSPRHKASSVCLHLQRVAENILNKPVRGLPSCGLGKALQ